MMSRSTKPSAPTTAAAAMPASRSLHSEMLFPGRCPVDTSADADRLGVALPVTVPDGRWIMVAKVTLLGGTRVPWRYGREGDSAAHREKTLRSRAGPHPAH